MLFYAIFLVVSLVVDTLTLRRKAANDKDLEIMVSGHQLRILQRKVDSKSLFLRAEKLILAVLTIAFKAQVKGLRSGLDEALLLFKPDTVLKLKWHRELVKRKWTFKQGKHAGRPRTTAEVEALIIRLTKDNPRWGCRPHSWRVSQAWRPPWRDTAVRPRRSAAGRPVVGGT